MDFSLYNLAHIGRLLGKYNRRSGKLLWRHFVRIVPATKIKYAKQLIYSKSLGNNFLFYMYIISRQCSAGSAGVNLCNPIIFVPVLPTSLSYRGSVGFISNKSEAASVLCKPKEAKLWPISDQRENCTLYRIDICTSVNTTWRRACTIQDFMERAGTTPTFLTWCQYYADSE